MSNFVEKLEKLGERAPTHMGFGAGAREIVASRSIMLVGTVTPGKLSKISKQRRNQIDALLVTLDSNDEKVLADEAGSLEGLTWGASAPEFDSERAAALKEAGCDFIVFEAAGTAASVLNDDDMGKIIRVSKDLDEETAAAIHDLPIDGALFSPHDLSLPLSVQQLIDLQRVRGMLGKLFLIDAPGDLSTPDLEAVRDAGTAALTVDALSKSTAELAKRVDGLEPKRHRHGGRDEVMARVPFGPDPAPAQDVDDGEEEEDY